MNVYETKINIGGLRHILNAAEGLQEAGENVAANSALRRLAETILEQSPAGTP